MLLNSVYVRYVTKVQTFLTALKVASLIMIICIGIVDLVLHDPSGNLKQPFKNSNWNAGAISVALYTGHFTYGGWSVLCILYHDILPY